MPDRYREREVARLRTAMERRLHSPRLQMALIVASAGAASFFASVALLHLGLTALWLRYPMAAAAGYATFLLLLWCWLRLQRNDLLEDLDPAIPGSDLRLPSSDVVQEDVWAPGGGRSGGGGASASFGEDRGATRAEHVMPPVFGDGPDGPGGFDAEDLAGIAAIVALTGAIVAAVWVTVAAPTFLAELMLDSALAAGLYRRLGAAGEGRWLRTAIEGTGWPFVVVMLGFALGGALMQTYAPRATSIGEVIQHYLDHR
jgi:hypothetical protein